MTEESRFPQARLAYSKNEILRRYGRDAHCAPQNDIVGGNVIPRRSCIQDEK